MPKNRKTTISDKFSNLSIRGKLLSGILFILVVFLINSSVNFFAESQTLDSLEKIKHNFDHLSEINKLNDLVNKQRIQVYVHLGITEVDEMEVIKTEIKNVSNKIRDSFQKINESVIEEAQEEHLLEEIEGLMNQYLVAVEETLLLSEEYAKEDGYAKANEVDKQLFEESKSKLGDLVKMVEAVVSQIHDDAHKRQQRSFYSIILSGIFTLSTIFVMIYIINALIRRINDIVETAQVLAKGDLTAIVDVDSKDEIGSLAKNLEIMRKNLYTLVEKMGDTALQLSSSTNDISALSQQQVHAISEQTSDINQFSASLNEMAATSNELGRNMDAIMGIVREATSMAKQGTSSIDSSLSSMDDIQKANDATGQRFDVLVEKVETIAKVLGTITSIADKTNLLSVNASIEAVKAGEFGKGFGVVASEIRRLADQTMIASQEIADMISEIQKAANSSMMSMDKSTMTTKEGVKTVVAAGQAISDLIAVVQEIGPKMEEMQEASSQQSEGSLKMTQVIKQIQQSSVNHKISAEQNSGTATMLSGMAKEQLLLVQSFNSKINDSNVEEQKEKFNSLSEEDTDNGE